MSHIAVKNDGKYELSLTLAFDAEDVETAERIKQSIQNAAILSAHPVVILSDLTRVNKKEIISITTERIKPTH